MNWPRIKWILISLLLAGNLLLLGLYSLRQQESERADDKAAADLLVVLNRQGVTLDPAVIPVLSDSAQRLYVLRDLDREAELAENLLGQTVRSDAGGRIYNYTGQDGWAQFRNGGQFHVEWSPPRAGSEEPARDAKARLAKAGFPDAQPPTAETLTDGVEVTLPQQIGDSPVVDAYVSLRYTASGALASLSGRWLWGTPLPSDEDPPSPLFSAALLRFVSRQADLGAPVSHLERVQLAYTIEVSSPDYACLTPEWRVVFDGRLYTIDAWSGEPVERD